MTTSRAVVKGIIWDFISIMETNNSQDFADYFNECLIIDQAKPWEDNNEDDSAKYGPDADFEAQWLRDIGFDSLVTNIEAGKDVDDDNQGMLFMSLTHHQAAVVKKKITAFKTTVRKRKLPKSRIRDVREVFPQNSESSSGGTRSRSATPDSLDSISPSHTPPSPRDWDPSRVSGSPTPSQGYYSHTRSSPDFSNSTDQNIDRVNSSSCTNIRHPYLESESSTEHPEKEPGFLQIFRTSSGNSSQPSSDDSSSNEQHYPHRTKNTVQEAPQLRHKFGYNFSSTGTLDLDSGIEVLQYHNKGSLWLRKNRSHAVSDLDISLKRRDERKNGSNQNLHNGENDWGFEKKKGGIEDDTDLPEFVNKPNKLGLTQIEDLGFEDIKLLRTLAHIELAVLFDTYDIQYSRRKATKKKKKDNDNVFGVALTTLLEKDKHINPDCKVPLILQKILEHLVKHGLSEEGILRVPGVVAKIQLLKQEIESHFYSSPGLVDQALKSSSINDVAALVKQFLRELPMPILTNDYMDAFFQIESITDHRDQIKAMKSLMILLPDVHRDSLKALFEYLAKIVKHETRNRMNLQNVAMIIAPNLFLPKKLKKHGERDLTSEINMAAVTCKITKIMIKYQDVIWTVPTFLVQQIRELNESNMYRRRNSKDTTKHVKKILGKSKKMEIHRKINNEVDFQDGVIRLQALQFGIQSMPIKLEDKTTAKDVVFKFIQEFKRTLEGNNKNKGQRDLFRRAITELSPDGNLSCLVSIADPLTSIDSHILYEVGGNIGERCLDSAANMFAVYQRNPNAEWEIRCKHWTNQPVVKEVMIM